MNKIKNQDSEKGNQEAAESDEKIEKTEEMEEYERETGKFAIWHGQITEGFKKWQKGEKIYDRDKERISLYIDEDTKKIWKAFKKQSNYPTISKLIRESVNYYIDNMSNPGTSTMVRMDPLVKSNLSHALKEPLTSIKGFSQLLLENYKAQLTDEVLSTVKNIFDQSVLLENKIVNILDDIRTGSYDYDVLLIEDDLPTIKLITSYFDSRGINCKGVISGSKGLEELENTIPKVILLDIILPDLSGYDLCKEIKSNEDLKEIPVYYLTAIPETEVETKLEETGANGYILKPFDFSDFAFILEKIKPK